MKTRKRELYLKSELHRDYFSLDAGTKEFLQRMLFFDYLEEAEEDAKGNVNEFMYEVLLNDLDYYTYYEIYEMAALMSDILKRFNHSFEFS